MVKLIKTIMQEVFLLVQVKEFKGTAQNPNVDDQINNFFQELASSSENLENLEILDIKYDTNIIQYRTAGDNTVKNAVVSSALLFYNT